MQVLVVYNYKLVSSATGYTPADAKKPQNELNVRSKLLMNAKRDRIYPELNVGDRVKVYKKSQKCFRKE
jgi:hypothetical protein